MRRFVLAALLLVAGTGHPFAAEATTDGAASLVDVFHRYLGTPRAGDADYVRVVPQGESYRLTFDLGQFAKPFETAGFALDPAEVSFVAAPLTDGTWRVDDLQLPSPLTVHFGEVTTTYRWEGVSFDGIFDPALLTFSRFEQIIASSDSLTSGPGVEGASHTGEQVVRGSANTADAGALDAIGRQTVRSMTMQQSVTVPPGEAAPPASFEISYGIETAELDVAIEAIEWTKLVDLWAYAVANTAETSPNFDNDEVRNRLEALLPIFRRVEETVAVHALRIGTPLGEIGVDDVSGIFTFSGLMPDSGMSMALKLAGRSYPEELVPDWAKGLIADEVELDFGLSGFNLDAAARHLIGRLDIDKTPMVEEADYATAAMLAIPESGAKFTLRPSRIGSPLIDLEFDGELALKMAAPSGTINIAARGIDDAIASLSSASGDPNAAKVLGILALAQQWGKKGADGEMRFAIEFGDDGAVTVNDQMVKPPSGQPL
jgi:hypothetical protein